MFLYWCFAEINFYFILVDEIRSDGSIRGKRAHSVSEQKNSKGVISQFIDKVSGFLTFVMFKVTGIRRRTQAVSKYFNYVLSVSRQRLFPSFITYQSIHN